MDAVTSPKDPFTDGKKLEVVLKKNV